MNKLKKRTLIIIIFIVMLLCSTVYNPNSVYANIKVDELEETRVHFKSN